MRTASSRSADLVRDGKVRRAGAVQSARSEPAACARDVYDRGRAVAVFALRPRRAAKRRKCGGGRARHRRCGVFSARARDADLEHSSLDELASEGARRGLPGVRPEAFAANRWLVERVEEICAGTRGVGRAGGVGVRSVVRGGARGEVWGRRTGSMQRWGGPKRCLREAVSRLGEDGGVSLGLLPAYPAEVSAFAAAAWPHGDGDRLQNHWSSRPHSIRRHALMGRRSNLRAPRQLLRTRPKPR